MIRQANLWHTVSGAPTRRLWRFPLLRLYSSLAQAGVRADMLDQEIQLERLAAFSRYHRHFRDDRLLSFKRSFAGYYKDAEVTAYSARIGDAVGLMAAHRENFCWFVHFEDLGIGNKVHQRKRPDYLIIDPFARRVRLLECKGSLGKAGPKALQGRLATALREQVEPWMGLQVQYRAATAPVPVSEGMVVGTLIKARVNRVHVEVVRPAAHPAAAVVSPVVGLGALHYSRYLRVLGLPRLARFLRQPSGNAPDVLRQDLRGVTLLRAVVAGQPVLFPLFVNDVGARLSGLHPARLRRHVTSHLFAAEPAGLPYPRLPGRGGPGVVLFGLAEKVFDALSAPLDRSAAFDDDRLAALLLEVTGPEQDTELELGFGQAPEQPFLLGRDGAAAMVVRPGDDQEWSVRSPSQEL